MLRRRLLLSLLALLGAALPPGCGKGELPAGPGDEAYAPDGSWLGRVAPTGRPMNVLIVVIDTLRADMLDPSAEGGPAMPALARRAAAGVRFTQASATSPWTLPSITSLLTGLLPSQHGVLGEEGQASGRARVPTAAQIAARALRMSTHAWVGQAWPAGPGGMLEGFDDVRVWSGLQAAPDQLGEFAVGRRADRPWFMLWHTFEAHDPYGEANHPHPYRPLLPTDGSDPVAPLRERSDPAELARRSLLDGAFRAALFRDPRNVELLRPLMRFLWNGLAERPRPELAAELRQAYTAGVRWVDGLLERALTFLEQAGLLTNTLLIVTGDHGEAFGEHGMLGHGRQLFDELLRVPLVILGPSPFARGRVIDAPVSLLDLLPTLLALRGLPPPEGCQGQSLLPLLEELGAPPESTRARANAPARACQAEETRTLRRTDGLSEARLASVRDGRWAWILTEERVVPSVREEVYDLQADPGQQRPLEGPAALRGFPPSPAFRGAMEASRARLGLAPATAPAKR